MCIHTHKAHSHAPYAPETGTIQSPSKWDPGMGSNEIIIFNSNLNILSRFVDENMKNAILLRPFLKLSASPLELVITHIHWQKRFCSHRYVKHAPCHHVLHAHKALGADRSWEITLSKFFIQLIKNFKTQIAKFWNLTAYYIGIQLSGSPV